MCASAAVYACSRERLRRLRAREPAGGEVLLRVRGSARRRRAAAAPGAEGRDRPLRRPRRVHVAGGADGSGGRARAALSVLRAAPRRARALRRDGGEVHRRRGDGALRGAESARGRPRARRPGRVRDPRLGREEERLQVRIAVNTGEALVTLDARAAEGEGMAAGDVVNTTARLQSAAPVNGILVGESTYRATRHAIEYTEAPPVAGQGQRRADRGLGGAAAAGELRRRRPARGAHGARRPRARARRRPRAPCNASARSARRSSSRSSACRGSASRGCSTSSRRSSTRSPT